MDAAGGGLLVGNGSNGRKVLVIWGQGPAAPGLEAGLERLGYIVTARAPSEEEALVLVREGRPDILIIGPVTRRGMDGIGPPGRMLRGCGLPVVLVSSGPDDWMARQAGLAEPFARLTGPLDDQKLQGAIEMAVFKHAAGKALRQSERRYRELVDNLSEVVVEIDMDGFITYVSRQSEAIFGFRPDEISGRNFADFVHPDFLAGAIEALSEIKPDMQHFDFEFKTIHKDGHYVYASVSGRLVQEENDVKIVGILKDITERKKAEEALRSSEERFRLLAENAKDMIYRVRLKPESAIEYVSPSASALTGYAPEEFYADPEIGLDLGSSGEGGGMRNVVMTRENMDRPVTMRWKRKDGSFLWAELVNRPVLDAYGQVVAFEGVARDITKRKEAEEQIIASLREKEVLLKEIHHRVKNNLQIIQSLLNMQFRRVKDKRVLDVLRESQNRVRSMALIHERLYRSTNLSRVDFKEYIGRLVSQLYTSYGADPGRIRPVLKLEDVRLGIDDAIPCGLMINELVSNVLKHAFPGGRRGMFWITLRTGPGGSVLLVIKDNGAGLPRGMDIRKTQTLGLQLVCTLVDQLDGIIESSEGKGTVFKISFNPGRPATG